MRSLSLAMSTARAPVFDVIVARIRCWWTPWPSCTSEALLSRIHGMSRLTASSTMAAVDGPNAVRSAIRMNSSSASWKSKPSSCWTRSLTIAHGEPTGGEADGLVDVAVDDVVATRAALDAAGLPARLVVARLGLQLQRDVLGDVAHPRALTEALDEAARVAAGAGVPLADPGSSSTSRSVKPGMVSLG